MMNAECGISCAYLFAFPSIHGEAAALALISQSALFHSAFRISHSAIRKIFPLAPCIIACILLYYWQQQVSHAFLYGDFALYVPAG